MFFGLSVKIFQIFIQYSKFFWLLYVSLLGTHQVVMMPLDVNPFTSIVFYADFLFK